MRSHILKNEGPFIAALAHRPRPEESGVGGEDSGSLKMEWKKDGDRGE